LWGIPPTIRDKVRQVSTRGQTHVSYKSPREDASKAAKGTGKVKEGIYA
jgi:hypothetical protein